MLILAILKCLLLFLVYRKCVVYLNAHAMTFMKQLGPRTGHEFICETSHVLLAGVSGVFSPGTPVFAPPTLWAVCLYYRLIRLDMSENA